MTTDGVKSPPLEEKQTSLIPMLMRLRHLDEPTLATKLQMQFSCLEGKELPPLLRMRVE
jgi:hypothetical protein